MKNTPMTIHFETTIYTLKQWTILSVPEDESVKLPSRGQISVIGKINGHECQTVLEPDGRWGQWMRVNNNLQKVAGVKSGHVVSVEMTTSKDWPEPDTPKDIADALKTAPQKVKDKWRDITPMARWDWIRCVNATSNMDTRAVRLEKTVSIVHRKHRRPCCFVLVALTDHDLAQSA